MDLNPGSRYHGVNDVSLLFMTHEWKREPIDPLVVIDYRH